MGRAFQNRKESMAKTAAAKTKVYSKYGREIYVCAKSGGVDPNANLSLRSLLDRAKKDQVPGHVIDRALEKFLIGVWVWDGVTLVVGLLIQVPHSDCHARHQRR